MNKGKLKPPFFAEWILNRISDTSEKNSIIGDFNEIYFDIAGENGVLKAKLWYWWQLFVSVPSFMKWITLGSFAMFKNYLKIVLRNMNKNKVYTMLNISGLTIGLTVFILVSLYIQFELSFDRHHEKAGKIFRVVQKNTGNVAGETSISATTPPAFAPALRNEFPEVVSSTAIGPMENLLISYGEKSFQEPVVHFAGPETFDIFTIPFISGDPATALLNPNSIVISRRTAEKYFGEENPVGKVLTLKEEYEYLVTGLIKNMPDNSHFIMDIIVPFRNFFDFKFGKSSLNSWADYSSFYTYFLLEENTGPVDLEKKLPALLNKYKYSSSSISEKDKDIYLLEPLTSIYLYSSAGSGIGTQTDIKYIYLFSLTAFLILIIACVNYMNLATARSVQRCKEVGLRKVVGANRGQLVRQFLGESLIFALFALAVSIIAAQMLLPAFNSFFERQLSLDLFSNYQIVTVILSAVIFTGLFAGIYPAFYITSLKPAEVLKGSFNKSTKGSMLRNILVTAQFSAAVLLIIVTLVVKDQLNFIKNKDMGYEKDRIMVIHVGDKGTRKNFHNNLETIKAELKRNPAVISVAGSKRLPHNVDFNPLNRMLPGKEPESYVPAYGVWGDQDFISLYGMDIVEGRNFSMEYTSDLEGAILINETAAKLCKWDSPIGRELTYWGNRTGRIVGIVKDFHFQPLHKPIRPLCIYYEPESFDYMSLKLNTDNMSETIAFIGKTIKKFSPGHPFEYHFFDDVFNKIYQTEQKIGSIFSVFATLSIIVACLGLFGLSLFTAEQKTKEIGIRKVLGASVSDIVISLSKEFTKLVLLGNLIAVPAAWYIMNEWLGNFAYRTDLSIFLFITACIISFLVALLTVSYQALKAAAANPVKSLKYE